MEAIDPRKLQPVVLARLLNSTDRGTVIRARHLRRHSPGRLTDLRLLPHHQRPARLPHLYVRHRPLLLVPPLRRRLPLAARHHRHRGGSGGLLREPAGAVLISWQCFDAPYRSTETSFPLRCRIPSFTKSPWLSPSRYVTYCSAFACKCKWGRLTSWRTV